MDDEFLGRGIVGRGGLEVGHIAAVPGLRHGEAAQKVQGQQLFDDVAMPFGTEIVDRAAEESPLHTAFHPQRQIGVGEHLERGHRPARIAGTTGDPTEAEFGPSEGGHQMHLLQHARSRGLVIQGGVAVQAVVVEVFPSLLAHVPPRTVEGCA